MFAATVESEMPDALKGLNASKNGSEPGFPGIDPPQSSSAGPTEWLAAHAPYYSENKVSLNPGVVNHLYPTDSLKIHRSETPNSTYGDFDTSLLREAAKASGGSYEEISGDFSKTSFSASRLALDLPARINERRREAIAISFYQNVYRCWLEEQLETGAIVAPKNAPAFCEAVDSYTNAKWRGKGRAIADMLKQTQAEVLALANGTRTYDDVLGEYGTDLEEVLEQRAAEKEMFEKAGLH
jgi:lambda family phage portal protein